MPAQLHPPQPRLGIIHLLLWMTGSGMMLALYRLSGREGNAFEEQPLFFKVMGLFHSMVSGAAVASIAVFAARRYRGAVPFPAEPGHYLLLIRGSLLIFFWIYTLAMRRILDTDPFAQSLFLYFIGWGCMLLIAAAGYVWPLFRLRAGRRWTVYFGIIVAGLGLQAASHLATAIFVRDPYRIVSLLLYSMPEWWTVISTTALLVVVVLDRRVHRDWLHWTGITVTFAEAVINVVWFVSMTWGQWNLVPA